MTSFKKPLSCILAVMLIIAFTASVPLTAFAGSENIATAEVLNKKTDGDFEYIKIDEDTQIEVIRYIGTDSTVNVPSKINNIPVVSVGDYCFAGNENVTEVKLNSSITSVGEGAFKDCTALTEVSNTKSLTSIGASLFEGCTAMTEFKIPDSVTAVPERCFFGCTALSEVKEHKNLKNVAADAFTGTAWEENAPEGALNLGRILYSYKGNVENLVIGEGIEIIESYVFLGCKDIKTVTFGEDVEEIGLYAFQNCTNLEEIKCGSAVSVIDAGAFKGCKSLKSADFSECTISAIHYEAFSGCTSLSDVKFSEMLTLVDELAFKNTAIKNIEFGKNVNEIGSTAFEGVETLESFTVSEKNKNYSAQDGVLYTKNGQSLVMFPTAKKGSFELPQKVKEIRAGAFSCSDISEIVFPEDTSLEKIGASAFENSLIEKTDLPETVTTIENSAFKNCSALSDVTLGSAVTYIGASAFEGCKSLNEITLPDTLRDIAAYAFKNTGLKSVNTGNGVRKIDTGAFFGNKSLTDLYLGESVKKLGDDSFAECSALVTVTLPASLESFSASVFNGCKSLKSVKVADGNKYYDNKKSGIYSSDGETLVLAVADSNSFAVADGTKTIAAGAFDNASAVSSISFPATLKNVEDNALNITAWYKNSSDSVVYAGKVLYKVNGSVYSVNVADGTVSVADNALSGTKVTNITFPKSLKYIGKEAFKDSSLKSVTITNGVKVIDDRAFENTIITSVKFNGRTLEELGSAVFKGCSKLKTIVLPGSLNEIPADAFANCKALVSVKAKGVKEIGKYAFSGCSSLESFNIPANVETVDPASFLGCENLTEISVDEANVFLKVIDGAVVSYNDEGEWNKIVLYPQGKDGSFTVPESVTEIGEKAFYDCDGLTEIIFHDGFKTIGKEAFFDCDSLTSVNMPEGAKSIGEYAFASCNELREFVVNSNYTKYENNTFDGCWYFNYDSVTINVPDSSGLILGIVVAVFAVIGVVWYLVYRKKQKKIEKEIKEKINANA